MSKSYYLEAVASNGPSGESVIHKFGHSDAVGTTFVPICHGNIYRTPQVSGATQLRVKAGNVNDTAAGTGARSVYIQGINISGELIDEILVTNGASAGTSSVNNYIRICCAYVETSGTYATSTTASHVGDIVIEDSAGTEDWLVIASANFPDGQSDCGVYTVPKGKTAYITRASYSVDTAKVTALLFYKRENILETAAPYSAIRKQFGISAAARDGVIAFEAPLGPFTEYTDIGWMAKVVSGTAEVSVTFDILLRDKE